MWYKKSASLTREGGKLGKVARNLLAEPVTFPTLFDQFNPSSIHHLLIFRR
ncbi:MAG: hypothetical protein KFF50_02515 [Desulfatitalea sp.]|nr:hypothetical protein [Desulfatitalea sp.]